MRSAREHRYHVPSREDVASRLRALARGETSRASVAAWAAEYITFDDPQIYPPIRDPSIVRALQQLAGADLPSTDREFLHEENDFSRWLYELESGT